MEKFQFETFNNNNNNTENMFYIFIPNYKKKIKKMEYVKSDSCEHYSNDNWITFRNAMTKKSWLV